MYVNITESDTPKTEDANIDNKKVNDFLETLKKTGEICTSDIITLECSVGVNMIPNNIKNRVSRYSSSKGLKEVIDYLSKYNVDGQEKSRCEYVLIHHLKALKRYIDDGTLAGYRREMMDIIDELPKIYVPELIKELVGYNCKLGDIPVMNFISGGLLSSNVEIFKQFKVAKILAKISCLEDGVCIGSVPILHSINHCDDTTKLNALTPPTKRYSGTLNQLLVLSVRHITMLLNTDYTATFDELSMCTTNNPFDGLKYIRRAVILSMCTTNNPFDGLKYRRRAVIKDLWWETIDYPNEYEFIVRNDFILIINK